METLDRAAKKSLLRKQPCFSKLTDAEMDGLADLLREKIEHEGDVIVREGDVVDSVYIIVDGTANVIHESIVAGEHKSDIIATLKPGDAIGLNETGFYSLSGVRTATVAAASEMVLLQLSVPLFHGFALDHPHVSFQMRKYAEDKLDLK